MINSLKKIYGINVTVSIVLLIFGLILFFKPETTINLVSTLLGIILIVMGGTSIIKFIGDKYQMDLVYGVISCVAGLILILNPTAVVSVLPFVLGIYFIISGISKFKYALDVRKYNGRNFITLLIISILITVCGVLFVINPFSGAVAITKIIGIFLVIYSVLDIVNYIMLRKDVKTVEEIFK